MKHCQAHKKAAAVQKIRGCSIEYANKRVHLLYSHKNTIMPSPTLQNKSLPFQTRKAPLFPAAPIGLTACGGNPPPFSRFDSNAYICSDTKPMIISYYHSTRFCEKCQYIFTILKIDFAFFTTAGVEVMFLDDFFR